MNVHSLVWISSRSKRVPGHNRQHLTVSGQVGIRKLYLSRLHFRSRLRHCGAGVVKELVRLGLLQLDIAVELRGLCAGTNHGVRLSLLLRLDSERELAAIAELRLRIVVL